MHFTCVLPEAPGLDQKCPICNRTPQDDGKAYPHLLEVGAPSGSRKELLSREDLPSKLLFPAKGVPTDVEAQKRGFASAKEWYVQTSTAYRHGQKEARPALESDFDSILPEPVRDEAEAEEDGDLPQEDETEDEDVLPLQSAASGGRQRCSPPALLPNRE